MQIHHLESDGEPGDLDNALGSFTCLEKALIYGQDYFGFVYLWRDSRRRMFCIGSHYGAIDDGYITSTGAMAREFQQRDQDFRRRIIYWLTIPDKRRLIAEEQRWINRIRPVEYESRYYNKAKLGRSPSGAKQRERGRVDTEVRGLLSRRGLNPSDLAKQSRVTPSYVSQVLTGKRAASLDWCNLVADVLRLSREDRRRLQHASLLDQGWDLDLSQP